MNDRQIPRLTDLDRVISKILTVSQEFMRQQEVAVFQICFSKVVEMMKNIYLESMKSD